MLARRVLALFLLFISFSLNAQNTLVTGFVSLEPSLMSKDHVPFWLRSNQYGSVPLPGSSISSTAGIYKPYDTINNPTIDWSAGISGRINAGNKVQGILTEGYVELAISEFKISLGRKMSVIGLMDTLLSTGSFASSGNALGIPKFEISVPSYYTIPILNGIFAVKGNFAFGWVGPMKIQTGTKGSENTYYHQKSLYVKFGLDNWRLHLIGGFNHQVMYGNEKKVFPQTFDLNFGQSFLYAALGKTYQGSKVGNHIGSIDFGLTYDFDYFRIFLYRQSFYDEGALAHLANIKDGLTGISFVNTSAENHKSRFMWKRFLLEYFYSKDQAGYPWSIPTRSGDENYYNNYEYAQGWSYKSVNLGNPLISIPTDTRRFDKYVRDYFNNNRIEALNIGFVAAYNEVDFIFKSVYSKNYGTFATSPYGISTGSNRLPPVGTFPEVTQLSFLFGFSAGFGGNYRGSLLIGFDHGRLLYDTQGMTVKIQKDL